MKLKDILNDNPVLIREYTEKTINTTIDRWKETNPSIDVALAKQVIQRFDQVKSGLGAKLQQIALSDELKQGQNYLNIDKYGWDDMVKLLRSLPEKDDKIKKEAIAMFMEKERIDKGIASSYVIRFMNNRRNLKYAIENGTEDGNFTKEEVQKLIPPRLFMGGSYLDPRVWDFGQLEHMLDALFPYYGNAEGGEEQNTATTDADKIYEQNGIEIYQGDAQHKCVAYNPTEGGRKKYGWCIAQVGNSNYDYYRFQQGTNRMFYICFDRNQPESNKWHAFVIHVGENNSQYWATSAKNDGDNNSKSWEGLSKFVDPQTWNRIKGLENVFKYIPPSKAEIASAALRGKKLSATDFIELDYDTKEQYIQSNAGSLSPEVLGVLDKELKNLAINYGQKFPYADLKDNEGLAKRYAVFRFRHTNYSKDPIPLPYVKYLDEEAKLKYLATFEDNLTYEYTEKFFGPKATEEYVQKQIDNLDFLPREAAKYIRDPKQRKIFEVYSKLFESWQFGDKTNLDEEELSTSFDMPIQDVDPKPLTAKQWSLLTPEDRKILINLSKQVNGKEKYSTLLYALPYIFEKDGQDLILLPLTNNDYSYEDWVLVDSNNKVIKKDIKGDRFNVGEQPLQLGFPNIDEDPRRVYPMSDLKSTGDNINEIRVNNPTIKFPIIINRQNNDKVIKKLADLGYKNLKGNIINGNIFTSLRNIPNEVTLKLTKNGDREYITYNWENEDDEDYEIDEIKVNNPLRYTEENYKDLYHKCLEEIEEYDVNDIIEKYVPVDVLEDYDIGQYEFFPYVEKTNPKGAQQMVKEMEEFYNEHKPEEETFEERFLRERLMNRAGIIK